MKRFVNATLILLILTPVLAYPVRMWLDSDYYWIFGAFSFLIAIIVFTRKLSGTNKINLPNYLVFILLAFFYYLLRGLENNYENYKGFSGFIYRNPALFTFGIFFIIENTKFSQKQIELFTKIFFITVICAFAVSLIQITIEPYFFTYREIEKIGFDVEEFRYRSIFSFSNSNDIGLSFLPIVTILLFAPKFQKNKKIKYAIMFMAFIVCFFSAARYIYIAFILIIIPHLKLKNILGTSLILLTFYVLASFFIERIGFDFSNFYENRILDESYISRLTAVDNFITLFPLNPFFGTGLHIDDNLRKILQGSSQMHIGYLSHLYEFGIIGSIFWFGAIISLSKRLFKQSKISGNKAGFYGYMVYVFANLTLVAYSMYFYGIVFCILFSKYYYQRSILETHTIKSNGLNHNNTFA